MRIETTLEVRSPSDKRKFDFAMQKVKHLQYDTNFNSNKIKLYGKLNQTQVTLISLMCLLLIGLVLVHHGVEATWKKEKGKGDFKIWLP